MSTSIRQSNLFAVEDWKDIYKTFRSADFQSYDYETLRKTMVDYLRNYYPEDFNDFIESSEFIALLDLISFMGQSLSYRNDLNTRENFLQTAERRDSVYRLAGMLGYSPSRNKSAHGNLKVSSVKTTEQIIDSNGVNLANRTIKWNDPTNADWLEQFVSIMNSALKNNQRIGSPSGSERIGEVRHDHYELNIPDNRIPIYNFSSTVDGRSMQFEIYNAGLDNRLGVYEKSPVTGNSLGFFYKTDGSGNSSPNTGFFFNFKQGRLTNLDFSIGEQLSNRIVSLNVDNINNDDVWLFEVSNAGGYTGEWTRVDQLRDSNIIYNDINDSQRKLFSDISRANDQVDLIFGDGTFSDIPVGLFRATARVSNGLGYSITPQEMRNINIDVQYVSKSGKTETLSLILNLEYTVNNASTRESLTDIKINAPRSYYSQNRMVNGEDYNSVPYVKYSDILKIKSVNRTSSGISRFLDINDFTAKYSSTNIFCEDGYIYKEENVDREQFTWTNASDVQNFVINTIGSLLKTKESINLYYHKYPVKIPPQTFWVKGEANRNSSSGFFVADMNQPSYQPQSIGVFSSNNQKFIESGSLLLFRAPAGFFFDLDRELTAGTPEKPGQYRELWASVKTVLNDGTADGNGYLNGTDGPGAVTITENIPTGAELVEIYPVYNNNLTVTVSQEITKKIINNEDFGLRYDQETRSWKIVNPLDIRKNTEFSLSNAGSQSRENLDASWFIIMTNQGIGRYQVDYRKLTFFWGSEKETRFYFDNHGRIYDSRNGTVIRDQIKVLEGNTLPDSSDILINQKNIEIYDTVRYADGYRDDSRVKITYADSDIDGIPDDPRVFKDLVNEQTRPVDKLVFFEKYLDFDNFERYRYFDNENVVVRFPTLDEIERSGRYAFAVDTIFYAFNDQEFYELKIVEGVRTIRKTDNFIVRVGRQNFKFQYRHNSTSDRRIDPSSSNLIDMYILNEAYNSSFKQWLKDTTGSVPKPQKPSLTDLEISYRELQNLKSVSDTILFNSAEFKILFGTKANHELQATFKVVKSPNSTISDSEIKSQIVNIIDKYFSIDNWDFGETFYFSELAAYIHQEMNQYISSIVIVPKSTLQQFGDLFQITCEPNEIFASAAGVDDIEIIDSVTASTLKNTETQIFGGFTPETFNS